MIQFLRAWNGYEFFQTATLSGAEETRLVGLGIATYYVPEPSSYTGLTTAQVAALGAVPPIYAQGPMVILGDSRGAYQWNFSGSNLYGSSARGAHVWLNYLLGAPWNYAQTPAMAVGGETAAQWADGHAAILALNPAPALVAITGPTNDVGTDLPAAPTQATLTGYIGDHLARGSQVLLEQFGAHDTWVPSRRQAASDMNAFLKATAALKRLNVFDRLSPITDGNMAPTAGSLFDSVHEATLGGFREAAMELRKQVARGGYVQPDWFSGSPWDKGVYNPRVVGGSTTPPGFVSQGTGGTYTKVARTDGVGGEWAQCVATAGSEAQSVGFKATVFFTLARSNSQVISGAGSRVNIGGNQYMVQTAGTTAASPPTMNTSIGATTTDGTVTWVRVPNIIPGATRIRILAEANASSTGGGAMPRLSTSFTPFVAGQDVYAHFPETGDTLPTMESIAGAPSPVLVAPDVLVPAAATQLDVFVVMSISNGATGTLRLGALRLMIV